MNLNKVFIIGRLTQDPEMRSTSTGQNVTTLNMATNRVWTDKSGQKQEAVEYHRVIAWARLGEIANQYLKKGGLVLIEGRLQTRSWTDQNNNKKYTTEIIAESLQLGPRTAGSPSAGGGSYTPSRPVVSDVSAGGQGEGSRGGTSTGIASGSAFGGKKPSIPDSDIPIIGEDEPVSAGMEEEERKISEKDLPF